jgi:ketosteroid isomerase-like protein
MEEHMPRFAAVVAAAAVLSVAGARALSAEDLVAQVRETENAFARTMADRDYAAFVGFLADETVFFGRGDTVRRGRAAVAEAWKPFFGGPRAPFSWAPARVEVLDSGVLALSTGPVRDGDGNDLGTFTSVWRREGDGHWRIVFDKGCPPCTELGP